jgi:hypothetical protein
MTLSACSTVLADGKEFAEESERSQKSASSHRIDPIIKKEFGFYEMP